MQTVLINTNSRASDCESLFGELNFLGTEEAVKKVIVMSCPLNSWFSEGGYEDVVKVLTDKIDNDRELDNNINIIVFASLSQWMDYLRLNTSESEMDMVAMYDILTVVLTRLVYSTIYKKLVELERLPANHRVVLLVEDCCGAKALRSKYMTQTNQAEGFIDSQHQAFEFLTGNNYDNNSPEDCSATVINRDCLHELFKQFINNDKSMTIGSVIEDQTNILKDKITLVEFAASNAQNDARLWLKRCYIIQSFVYECTVNGVPEGNRVDLTDIDFNTIQARLKEKRELFSCLLNKIESSDNISENDVKSKEIRRADNNRFGLDETGSVKKSVVEATREELPNMNKALADKRKRATRQEETGITPNIIQMAEEKPECILDENQLINVEDGFVMETAPKEAGDYCKKAMTLVEYHLKLLRKLDAQVNDVLHGYSYSPNETEKPKLGKRLKAQDHYRSVEGTRSADLNDKDNESVLDSAKRIADRGYRSLLSEYVEENNNQSIESTSIIKQTDTFVKRIRELEAAMNRILAISAGFCGGLLVLTAFPFLMIQLKSLLTNPGGIPIAIGFILAPVLLYFLCILFIKAIYKKRMRELWEQLVEEHERIMNHNEQSVERFNDVIGRYIPALRYYYGYFMDLRFFERYKRIRDAKVLHHKRKLAECLTRVTEVLNLIDSGFGSKRIESSGFDEVKIDFNQSFYGEHNRKIYSLFDSVNNENA